MAVCNQFDWKIIIMTKPSGGSSHNSYRFKKPKPKIKIGGVARLFKHRRVSRRKNPLVGSPVFPLDSVNAPEPSDKFHKGLWSCTTEEMVLSLFNKWWKGFNRKARRSVKHRKIAPGIRSTLEALLDRPGATSTPLLNSQLICTEAYKFLHAQLVALAAADPEMEVGFVTFICGTGATSHNRPVIELCESQAKVQRTLRAMSENFFGITELVLFNSHTHADGGQLVQRHEHALIWGKNILARASLIAAKHASHFAPNFTNAPIINVKRVPINAVNLARMAAYLFKPPYKCLT